MQHEHGHAAWEWTCRTYMDIDMQHEHGYAACIWACSMDMGMQHGKRHAAWAWACSMSMGMLHGRGHAVWTWTCSMALGMMLGNHCCIIAVLMHSTATFLLLLPSFPCNGRQWWPFWPSPLPSSEAITVRWSFYFRNNAVMKAVWNFQCAMTIFKNIIAFFAKGQFTVRTLYTKKFKNRRGTRNCMASWHWRLALNEFLYKSLWKEHGHSFLSLLKILK